MPQLSLAEMRLIDKMVRKEKKRPADAWRALRKARGAAHTKDKKLKKHSLKKTKRLRKNTVYEYCNGEIPSTASHFLSLSHPLPFFFTARCQ